MEKYHEIIIEIPEGCSVSIEDNKIKVKGPNGEVSREIKTKVLRTEVDNNKLLLYAEKPSKNYKKMVATYNAHIKNMIKGVTEGHTYKLKICSGHFPMSVNVKSNNLELKNFLGEANPRLLDFDENVNVKVNGDEIIVDGINKEKVAQTAADIEAMTKRPNFDRRIFQDGIYITVKDGKKLGK